MNIGDLMMRIVASDAGFEADLVKQGQKAGDAAGAKAGTSFSSRLSTALKATIGGAVGGAIGAGLAIATKGGAELNAAVTAFAADTGATAEEAAQAQSTIGELFRTNLQGFGEIGGTLAKLRTDLGLTQEAADAAAQSYLDFSQVAGGTGAEAVGRFDDILDGFNLSAEAAPGIMDKLVASHQRFGGSINASAEALAGLAPALTAANLGVDDGIGLLNMFASSGVDAADAPAALTKALSRVKSPAELKKLLADITATEDPFARAQLAAELFGAKAGPKLAAALSKGGIDDFKISFDEAAGASTRAADTIQSDFGNQAQLVLHNFGGALAGIGSNFGPLILGFATLAPALAPVVTVAGTAVGGFLAAAIPIGMAALPVLLVGALVAAVAFLVYNPEIVGQIGAFAGSVVANVIAFLAGLPGALLGAFGPAFGAVIGATPGFILKVALGILTLPFRIADLLVKMLEFFAGIFASILAGVPGFIASLVGFLFGIPGKLVELGVQMVQAIIGGLASLPGQLANAIGDAFRNLRVDVGPFHVSGSGITIDLPNIELPSFAVGSMFIPADMLAVVHKGEMIIPADASEAIRQGRSTIGTRTTAMAAPTTVVYNNTANVEGLVKATSPLEIARQLGRFARNGQFTPQEPA